ncbi:uroporphyrinogen-III synthase [Serinibacter arcticus]|uniref:Uroporphyrinogen-III synthase n=1 Tax=Serinibacter arcticus TaxID=1655435 RepID=A0A2U1ZWM8_9MICO|nr:uroporphyrinogen-III synthase [Serinibacter arcticus]PWD51397.1 uroporphyrinogen-III synthase [Serinibacter arcticus]
MNSHIDQVLTGCVVLITAERRATELAAALVRRGAQTRHAPALSMLPHADDQLLLERTREVIANPPDVVLATTGIGFRAWIEAADTAGLAEDLVRAIGGARLIARGPKARGAIQAAGLTADWVAESETSEEVAELLLDEGVEGLDIVIQHHGAGADGLDEQFRDAGAQVHNIVVYRWGPPKDPALVLESVRAVADGEIDAVTFTSAPAAAAWLGVARDAQILEAVIDRDDVLWAAVGPITAAPLRDAGIEPLIPDRGRLGSFVRALTTHFASQPGVATSAGALHLRRGGAVLDGRDLALTPSGLAVLRLLTDNIGSVVSREAVLGALPGGSTDPHAAEVAIARLRDAVGRQVIRTVVKRGYRLETQEDA